MSEPASKPQLTTRLLLLILSRHKELFMHFIARIKELLRVAVLRHLVCRCGGAGWFLAYLIFCFFAVGVVLGLILIQGYR